MEIGTLVIS